MTPDPKAKTMKKQESFQDLVKEGEVGVMMDRVFEATKEVFRGFYEHKEHRNFSDNVWELVRALLFYSQARAKKATHAVEISLDGSDYECVRLVIKQILLAAQQKDARSRDVEGRSNDNSPIDKTLKRVPPPHGEDNSSTRKGGKKKYEGNDPLLDKEILKIQEKIGELIDDLTDMASIFDKTNIVTWSINIYLHFMTASWRRKRVFSTYEEVMKQTGPVEIDLVGIIATVRLSRERTIAYYLQSATHMAVTNEELVTMIIERNKALRPQEGEKEGTKKVSVTEGNWTFFPPSLRYMKRLRLRSQESLEAEFTRKKSGAAIVEQKGEMAPEQQETPEEAEKAASVENGKEEGKGRVREEMMNIGKASGYRLKGNSALPYPSMPSVVSLINGLLGISQMFADDPLGTLTPVHIVQNVIVKREVPNTPPYDRLTKKNYSQHMESQLVSFNATLMKMMEEQIYDPSGASLFYLSMTLFSSPSNMHLDDSRLSVQPPTKIGGKEMRKVVGSILVRMKWVMSQLEFYLFAYVNGMNLVEEQKRLKGASVKASVSNLQKVRVAKDISMLIFHAVTEPLLKLQWRV